jgi:hypothetical protein
MHLRLLFGQQRKCCRRRNRRCYQRWNCTYTRYAKELRYMTASSRLTKLEARFAVSCSYCGLQIAPSRSMLPLQPSRLLRQPNNSPNSQPNPFKRVSGIKPTRARWIRLAQLSPRYKKIGGDHSPTFQLPMIACFSASPPLISCLFASSTQCDRNCSRKRVT